MVLKLKQKIVSHLRQHLNCSEINCKSIKSLNNCVNNEQMVYKKPKLYINLNQINSDLKANDIKNSLQKLSFISEVFCDHKADDIESTKPLIVFEIDNQFYVKELIESLKYNDLKDSYGENVLNCGPNGAERVVIEFSSPNIAKPFHVGNYRSTIIGNFVANLYQFCGHTVTRLNYLGDFGTQFGILSLAYDSFGDDQCLAANPLQHLFEVYVKGNTECKASEEWRESAKSRFNALERQENPEVLSQWQRFRELSVDKLKDLYLRLGIDFDHFHSESMYSMASKEVMQQLRQLGLLEVDESGAQFAIIGEKESNNCHKIPVLKSDGSTLYLTRDIAAALHRRDLYSFDKMFYIVDNSQSKHFKHLFNILNQFNSHLFQKLFHLRFGRIIGMSTRKGNIIFLEDVLNEAKERSIESLKTSPNTKVSEDLFESVADVLGMSGLLVNDLSHRRASDYRFNWDKALKHTGDTGIAFQYTHSRLCSIELKSGFEFDINFEPKVSALSEFEAFLLIHVLSQFDDVLHQTFEDLEPSRLVNYLFELKNAINRAHLVLRVKGEEPDVAKTRLLLFRCARNVLKQGMTLLGLKALNSM